jgi:hypothetical protein
MPHDILKIQIKEEFYYPIAHILIEREPELLIVNLVDINAYHSLATFVQNSTSFKAVPNKNNLRVPFKENTQDVLLFLREYDLFSENTYLRAIEELSKDSEKLINETSMAIIDEEKKISYEITTIKKNNYFSFFNFAKETSTQQSFNVGCRCSIQ